jgi:hypothetical protein
MDEPTCLDIATDYSLWCEYVDTGAVESEEIFNSRSTEENLKMMLEMYPEDEDEIKEALLEITKET